MGVDITVLIIDWEHIEEAPPDQRMGLLEDALYPEDDWDLEGLERGWVWPSAPGAPWVARYEFYRTLGSFKPHFWAGEAWEKFRDFVDPGLRATLDGFLSALIWDGPDRGNDAAPVHGLVLCGLETSLAYPPQAVPALVQLWADAAPRLEELRDPFAIHGARPEGWMKTFDEFADLLRDWGEVVGEANRRRWGLIKEVQ
ncbi:hypothetical protein [Actinomadura sp. 9N407]|uniref:hypothetical protein n=1 Tax=Actinomadura sp. 9N407 TaxID=3375154 RepID=UPI00379B6AE2